MVVKMQKINFEVNEQILKNTQITLTELNSELWGMHRGAYGDIWNEIAVLEKVISGEDVEAEVFESTFETLCEGLWHQLSFYDAGYLAMPYLLKLLGLKIKEQDFQWQLRLFSEMGMIVTTDIPRNHYTHDVEVEIVENYNRCLLVLAELEKQFIMKYLEQIAELESNSKSYFYTTALAVLDDREAAFVLTSLLYNEIYVVCGACGTWNEELPEISQGEIKEIEPAETVIGKWDGKSFENTYIWYSNFLHMLGDDHAANVLSYYYGTYTCPECGQKALVMDVAKKYIEE